jgi:nucleotide-binding universal stress UspA family protein
MSTHKVLIPLDGSEFSRQILPQVRRFLSPHDNELILFRVASPPQGLINKPTQPAAAEWPLPMHASHQDAKLAKHPIYASQVQDSLVATLENEYRSDVLYLEEAGYTVRVAVRFGDPVQEILGFIREQDVDLVALTSHGRTGLSRFIFGSVAEGVLHKASVPVMLVRPIEHAGSLRAQDKGLNKKVG